MVYEKMGELDAAIRELEEALRLQPGLEVARRNLERIEKLQASGSASAG